MFTGQREITGLGIYHYNARFYSPYLNHMIQPDTIVPDPANPQDWNRYIYANNNPLNYTDPSGHMPCEDEFGNCLKPPSKNNKPIKPTHPKNDSKNSLCKNLLSSGICNNISKGVGIGVLILDIQTSSISIAGSGIEILAGFGLELSTPIPGADGATGFGGAVANYRFFLNPMEDAMSTTSLIANFGNELLITGDTYLQDTSFQLMPARELVIGPDTTLSIVTTMLGNKVAPEAITDTIVNVGVVVYDVHRLRGGEGLTTLHVGRTDRGLWYYYFGEP